MKQKRKRYTLLHQDFLNFLLLAASIAWIAVSFGGRVMVQKHSQKSERNLKELKQDLDSVLFKSQHGSRDFRIDAGNMIAMKESQRLFSRKLIPTIDSPATSFFSMHPNRSKDAIVWLTDHSNREFDSKVIDTLFSKGSILRYYGSDKTHNTVLVTCAQSDYQKLISLIETFSKEYRTVTILFDVSYLTLADIALKEIEENKIRRLVEERNTMNVAKTKRGNEMREWEDSLRMLFMKRMVLENKLNKSKRVKLFRRRQIKKEKARIQEQIAIVDSLRSVYLAYLRRSENANEAIARNMLAYAIEKDSIYEVFSRRKETGLNLFRQLKWRYPQHSIILLSDQDDQYLQQFEYHMENSIQEISDRLEKIYGDDRH